MYEFCKPVTLFWTAVQTALLEPGSEERPSPIDSEAVAGKPSGQKLTELRP